jgi:alcohol dehydrogenase (nicotinoprotein)
LLREASAAVCLNRPETPALQGAVHAGATKVVAVDPLGNKLTKSQEFGATHVASNAQEAQQIVLDITRGVGADAAVITVGVVDEAVITNGFNIIRKGGTVVVTAVSNPTATTIQLPGTMLTLFEKRLQGSLYGSGNPFSDIPMLLQMYRSGQLKLDELITSRYKLSEVNQGYRDLHDGKNVRGIIVHEH